MSQLDRRISLRDPEPRKSGRATIIAIAVTIAAGVFAAYQARGLWKEIKKAEAIYTGR